MDYMPAIQDAEATAAPLDDTPAAPASSRGSSDELDLDVESLGGGNPNICFINHRIQAKRAALGKLDKATVERTRKAAASEFDQSESTRARWNDIFSMVSARRKLKKSREHQRRQGND